MLICVIAVLDHPSQIEDELADPVQAVTADSFKPEDADDSLFVGRSRAAQRFEEDEAMLKMEHDDEVEDEDDLSVSNQGAAGADQNISDADLWDQLEQDDKERRKKQAITASRKAATQKRRDLRLKHQSGGVIPEAEVESDELAVKYDELSPARKRAVQRLLAQDSDQADDEDTYCTCRVACPVQHCIMCPCNTTCLWMSCAS